MRACSRAAVIPLVLGAPDTTATPPFCFDREHGAPTHLDDPPVLPDEVAVLAVQVVDAPEVARLDLARGHDLEPARFVLRRRHGREREREACRV